MINKKNMNSIVLAIIGFATLSFAISIIKEILYLDLESTFLHQIINILISFIGMIFMDIAFLWLLCFIRKNHYNFIVINNALKKSLYFIVTGFIISVIQIIVNTLFTFTIYVPFLYTIISSLITVIFLLWNMLAVFSIIDGESSLYKILTLPLNLMKRHAIVFLKYSIPFILWAIFQQEILMQLIQRLSQTDNGSMMLQNILSVNDVHIQITITLIYFFTFIGQFSALFPFYLVSTKYYDKDTSISCIKINTMQSKHC